MTKHLISIFSIVMIAVLALPSPVCADVAADITAKEIADFARHYAWVERLSIGPTLWSDDSRFPEDQEGVSYRVSTVISEIYVSMYIEKLSIGGEGCCKKLLSIRKIDDREFTNKFQIKGEFTDFSVHYWESPTSFVASAMGRTFLFSRIDKEKITVTEIPKPQDSRIRMKSSNF